jgi:hypothetical protein
MAINITVYPLLSPRIIVIDSPTTSASIQEIVDAIREWEDNNPGMGYEYLIDAAGKEDLGGGVAVAITAQLNNAKIMFESRRTIVSTGTVTTGDSTGFLLTDSAADFVSDGVELGAEIHNITDGSSCCVIDVTSSTELLTDYLAGGTDNQFDIGDSYVVWNQEVCEISGGNLVAVDDVGASIEPVVPSFGTYVKVAAASSATLVDSGGGLTVGAIADAVWDEDVTTHTDPDSTGEALAGASAPTTGEVADAVWDEILTGATHNVPTSAGRRLRQLGDVVSSTVNDASATTSAFITNLTESRDGFYEDQIVRFTSGNLFGLVRPISNYDGTSKTITVDEPMVEAPDNGIGFDIIPTHVHPVAEIASAVWEELVADHTTPDTMGEQAEDTLKKAKLAAFKL